MKKKHLKKISSEELAYIAGFIDGGSGSILVQVIQNRSCRYGYFVKTTVTFYQETTKHWVLIQLRELLGREWSLTKKENGMSELSRSGFDPVKTLLTALRPYARTKQRLLKLTLKVIEDYPRIQSETDFLEVVQTIDKIAKYHDVRTRERLHNYDSIRSSLNFPVET